MFLGICCLLYVFCFSIIADSVPIYAYPILSHAFTLKYTKNSTVTFLRSNICCVFRVIIMRVANLLIMQNNSYTIKKLHSKIENAYAMECMHILHTTIYTI